LNSEHVSSYNTNLMAYINLDYLKSMADGDPEIMKEMTDIFIAQVPEFIENLNIFLNEGRYLELGKEAHRAKSSVMIMGMDELAKDLKALQLATIAGTGVETYPQYVREFEVQCLGAIEELNKGQFSSPK
jgi:HPt (histidine-containing phosphotransfer) domain-containing protein